MVGRVQQRRWSERSHPAVPRPYRPGVAHGDASRPARGGAVRGLVVGLSLTAVFWLTVVLLALWLAELTGGGLL